MPWVDEGKGFGAFTKWVEPTVDDDTIVTLSVGALISALSDALKVATVVPPAFTVGERVLISATVTGVHKNAVNVVFDDVPDHVHRSFTYHKDVLAAATSSVKDKKAA